MHRSRSRPLTIRGSDKLSVFLVPCNRRLRTVFSERCSPVMSKELRSPRHDALRKLLKLERVKAEISQTELAKRLGWAQATISDIERGNKIVNVLELISIAQVLDIDPNDIIKAVSKIKDT